MFCPESAANPPVVNVAIWVVIPSAVACPVLSVGGSVT
jgi:hypothetical protein